MGIKGLLPQLRPITETVNISAFAGHTIAVDAYGWLHRGAIACAKPLCQGKNPTQYIRFVATRVQMLLDAGVKPVLVFDGGPLPAKQQQEIIRAERRRKHFKVACELEACGSKAAAYKMYRQALDITPLMAKRTIHALNTQFQDKVKCIVAPYEADAQLAWLALNGHVHAVLSDDSDLLTFGVQRLLVKLDNEGQADFIALNRLHDAHTAAAMGMKDWTHKRFRLLCILSGCDYVANVEGIGIKTALAIVRRYADVTRVVRALRLGVGGSRRSRLCVPVDYEAQIERAELTFCHQRVYDITTQSVVTLTPLDDAFRLEFGDGEFLGAPIDDEIGRRIAQAEFDPVTRQPFDDDERTLAHTVSAISPPKRSCGSKRARKLASCGLMISPPPKHRPITQYFSRISPDSRKDFVAPRSHTQCVSSEHETPTVISEHDESTKMKQSIPRPIINACSMVGRVRCVSSTTSKQPGDAASVPLLTTRTFTAPSIDLDKFRFQRGVHNHTDRRYSSCAQTPLRKQCTLPHTGEAKTRYKSHSLGTLKRRSAASILAYRSIRAQANVTARDESMPHHHHSIDARENDDDVGRELVVPLNTSIERCTQKQRPPHKNQSDALSSSTNDGVDDDDDVKNDDDDDDMKNDGDDDDDKKNDDDDDDDKKNDDDDDDSMKNNDDDDEDMKKETEIVRHSSTRISIASKLLAHQQQETILRSLDFYMFEDAAAVVGDVIDAYDQ